MISFPRGTEMFQFPRLPPGAYVFSADDTALPVPGFPIRESAGQRLFSASPRLIAAVHALLRLLVPRHPPCALTILTVIVPPRPKAPSGGDTRCLANCAVFKVRRGRTRGTPPAGLSKLSSSGPRRERTRAASRLGRHSRDASRLPTGLNALAAAGRDGGSNQELPRKEVIQPHLPVRLPCYDFTPITSPTFDGSLPKGWVTGFGCCPLSWCDGRCVQGPGTYSPRRC